MWPFDCGGEQGVPVSDSLLDLEKWSIRISVCDGFSLNFRLGNASKEPFSFNHIFERNAHDLHDAPCSNASNVQAAVLGSGLQLSPLLSSWSTWPTATVMTGSAIMAEAGQSSQQSSQRPSQRSSRWPDERAVVINNPR